jgi:hypothetical protein
MLTLMTAMALAAVAPAAPAQSIPMGQMPGMDMSQMDHSKMGQMNMAQHGDGCCKHGADGKMECSMSDGAGAKPAPQGHSAH